MSLVALSAFIGLPYLFLRLTPDFLAYDIGAFRWLGLISFLPGLALVVYTGYSFIHHGKGTPAPFDPPKALVVKGPYRIVRNPMYVGAVSILIGESIILQSLPILFYALAMWLLFHLFVIYYEEPNLRKRFGATYEEYCRTVPRWVPKLTVRR